MFKRRDKRSTMQIAADTVYPRGGWARAASYVYHRIRRLPDRPSKIARGIACGVFVSFSPLFGMHFFYAGLLAMVIRGNVLASLLATFVGNPITFPFIAAISLETGSFLLGRGRTYPLHRVVQAFSDASGELWRNFTAIFTDDVTRWASLERFFHDVFLPYLVGGLLPGLVSALVAFFVTRPIISAYQRRRLAKMRTKFQPKMPKSAARQADGTS